MGAIRRERAGNKLVVLAGLWVVAMLTPFVVRDGYVIHLLNVLGIYVILSAGLNISVGLAGLLHLGHAGFYGLGAYAGAITSTRVIPGSWLGFWAGLPVAVVLGMLAGAVLGAPSLRLRGHYFAIATLGFGEIMRSLMLNLVEITQGPFGIKAIPSPRLGSFDLGSGARFYCLVFAVVTLVLLGLWNLQHGRFGRFWQAVREDEVVAQVMGVNVFAAKMWALMISSGLAAVAGWLYAHYVSYINPSNFSLDESILVLCMVILGGRGTFWGPVIGSALLVLFPELLRPIAELRLLVYGVALVVLMAVRPEGVVGTK
ncbi:MAG: branched-chain amino acid ABC transporter permease [Firmicutes bacterium]|nr:branched-chain amino acid ABC transporter permease [Bacillota bacterium]